MDYNENFKTIENWKSKKDNARKNKKTILSRAKHIYHRLSLSYPNE